MSQAEQEHSMELKKVLYVIVANRRFEGLFRSLSAANRWAEELRQWPVHWHQGPEIIKVHSEDQEFPGLEQYDAAWRIREAVSDGHFGRVK